MIFNLLKNCDLNEFRISNPTCKRQITIYFHVLFLGNGNGNSLTYNNRWQWPHNDTDCMAMEKRWLLTQEDNPIYQHGLAKQLQLCSSTN